LEQGVYGSDLEAEDMTLVNAVMWWMDDLFAGLRGVTRLHFSSICIYSYTPSFRAAALSPALGYSEFQ
jgi:hypothetical protein